MPAPRHLRLTYSGVFGTIAAPAEDWQFGLSASLPSAATVVTVEDCLALADRLALSYGSIGSRLHSAARLSRIRVAMVGNDGKYERTAGGQMIFADKGMDVPGTATGALAAPLAVSLAIGLRTGLDSPVGRGRFYLPAPSLGTLDSVGRISTAQQTTFSNSARTWIDAVNADLLAQTWGRVVVASGGSVTKGIPAALRVVTAVEVGLRPDIQQRRHAEIQENHTVQPLSA